MRKRKGGTLIDVSLTVSPIMDSDGTIIGASKIARDIGERKRAARAERRANQGDEPSRQERLCRNGRNSSHERAHCRHT